MNLKLKAALQTAGVLAVICTVSVGVQLLLTGLTADEISKILSVGSITLLVYCMYQLVLSRLEYTQKLEEIVQKKQIMVDEKLAKVDKKIKHCCGF
jgi:hypothetical protein